MCKQTAPACKNCPWRIGGLQYDADGLEAFIDGYDASCHEIVGKQRVFADQPAKNGNECRGPFHVDAGTDGYRDATIMVMS